MPYYMMEAVFCFNPKRCIHSFVLLLFLNIYCLLLCSFIITDGKKTVLSLPVPAG